MLKLSFSVLGFPSWFLLKKVVVLHKNMAKYTFKEQCEEVRGLYLNDGTTKIFLNMDSKNGSQELIILLQ